MGKKDLGEFEDNYNILLESHDSQFLRVTPLEDENKNMIIIIVLWAAIFIVTIFLAAFYFKKNKNKPKNFEDNNKLIDSKGADE